jgi:hypothetical protein
MVAVPLDGFEPVLDAAPPVLQLLISLSRARLSSAASAAEPPAQFLNGLENGFPFHLVLVPPFFQVAQNLRRMDAPSGKSRSLPQAFCPGPSKCFLLLPFLSELHSQPDQDGFMLAPMKKKLILCRKFLSLRKMKTLRSRMMQSK